MAKTKEVLTAGIVAIVIYHARMAPDHAMKMTRTSWLDTERFRSPILWPHLVKRCSIDPSKYK